jgi:hypothetical protein
VSSQRHASYFTGDIRRQMGSLLVHESHDIHSLLSFTLVPKLLQIYYRRDLYNDQLSRFSASQISLSLPSFHLKRPVFTWNSCGTHLDDYFTQPGQCMTIETRLFSRTYRKPWPPRGRLREIPRTRPQRQGLSEHSKSSKPAHTYIPCTRTAK